MLGLITDRSQRNVYRRKELADKGWAGMTTAERAEWLGNPLETEGANLFACGPYYSSVVHLNYRSEDIIASATAPGTYLYAVSIIGNAGDYENKVFTLSADSITTASPGTPQLAVYWHDDNGYEYAGASLLSSGSVTFNTVEWPNANKRAYLAVYVYVTTYEEVAAGATVRFARVMLESGSVRHEYVPYTEIIPTLSTKGAYNHSDLNRVERAVAELSGHYKLGLVTKTDWTAWDVPTEADMIRYLGNIVVFRSRLPNGERDFPLPSSMSNLTYELANNIELILKAVSEGLTHGY